MRIASSTFDCRPAEIADKAASQSCLQLYTAAAKNSGKQSSNKPHANDHIRCHMHTHHLPSAHVSTLAKMPTNVVLVPIVQQMSFLKSSMR